MESIIQNANFYFSDFNFSEIEYAKNGSVTFLVKGFELSIGTNEKNGHIAKIKSEIELLGETTQEETTQKIETFKFNATANITLELTREVSEKETNENQDFIVFLIKVMAKPHIDLLFDSTRYNNVSFPLSLGKKYD